MPKVKSSLKNKISSWIAPYNKSKEIFSTDGKIIYCLVCDKNVSSEKKYFLDHHSETGKFCILYFMFYINVFKLGF